MQEDNDIAGLRRRAEWYRAFAQVGSADNKAGRLSLARHFDRLADDLAASGERAREDAGAAMADF
jgi:hypothetical protein